MPESFENFLPLHILLFLHQTCLESFGYVKKALLVKNINLITVSIKNILFRMLYEVWRLSYTLLCQNPIFRQKTNLLVTCAWRHSIFLMKESLLSPDRKTRISERWYFLLRLLCFAWAIYFHFIQQNKSQGESGWWKHAQVTLLSDIELNQLKDA